MNKDNPEIAISIQHVSKQYKLGQIGGGTLQHDLQSWWAKRLGKEDPNSIVGQNDRVVGNAFLALNDLSLEVKKGEAIGIIGRNGAGKSTLLKILSRTTAPTAGTIDIYGRLSSLLEIGTGFHPEMTGKENIYLNGAILGMTRAEIDEQLDSIIDFAEIGPFIETPVKRYSSGMYVRLAFSVAAHLKNEILLMDEVLSVGDVVFQKKCLERMISEAASGKTIVYVSHDLRSVRRLCDRCAVLQEGKLVYLGRTESAIEIYLNTILNNDTRRDLSEIPRSARLTDRRMMLVMAEYPGKTSICFGDHEKMQMHLHWINLKDYQNLCIRAEVWTIEDILQASTVFYDVRSGKAGEEEDFTFELDVSCFAHATYKTKFTFFFRDEHGFIHDTDRVIGLFFERTADTNVIWDVAQWGYVRLQNAREIPSVSVPDPASPDNTQ